MVVCDQPQYARNFRFVCARLGEQRCGDSRAFHLLIFARAAAVLAFGFVDADVVQHSCGLERVLRVCVQPLSLIHILTMKKPHPCGSKQWKVLRTGMDFKLKCAGCGHEVMLPRSKAEKNIKLIEREGKPVC